MARKVVVMIGGSGISAVVAMMSMAEAVAQPAASAAAPAMRIVVGLDEPLVAIRGALIWLRPSRQSGHC